MDVAPGARSAVGRDECIFVGDAKYKTTAQGKNDDLYQLLAYCIATDLNSGMLVYAEAPFGGTRHQVLHAGPTLIVETLDLAAPLPDVQARCTELAEQILDVARHQLSAV